ncbi:MAG: hypothetical protein ACE5JR_02010 [Gemmatimonadota bacterium]
MAEDASENTPTWTGTRGPHGGEPSPGAFHIWKPRPLLRSIHWTPIPSVPHSDRLGAYEVFFMQQALEDLLDHVWRTPLGEEPFGFLVGDLCEDPDAESRYVLVSTVVRSRLPFAEDSPHQISAEARMALQLEVDRRRGILVGWYHRHSDGPAELTESDVATHERHFGEPWQSAVLVVTDHADPRGGFFRRTAKGLSGSRALPFYELVTTESLRGKGLKRSRLDWTNVSTEDSVVREPSPRPEPPAPALEPEAEVAAEPVATSRAETPAQAAAERETLVVEGSRAAEEVPVLAKEPPAAAAAEAARKAAKAEAARKVAEGKAAEEKAARKAAEEKAARKAAEAEAARKAAAAEAARKAAAAEAARKAAEAEAARKAAEEEAARRAAREAEERAMARARARTAGPRPAVALEDAGADERAAVRGGPAPPARPAPTAPPLVVTAEPRTRRPLWARQAALIAASVLVVVVVVVSLVAVVRGTGPGAESGVSPAAPSVTQQLEAPQTAAEMPGAASGSEDDGEALSGEAAGATAASVGGVLGRLDLLSDAMVEAISRYYGVTVSFDAGRVTCSELQAVYVRVEDAWIDYNANGKARVDAPLDSDRVARDSRLYEGVQDVERLFAQTGCDRP